MPNLSRRASALGTENAFVVLAEVNRLIRDGKDIVSFCIGQPDFPTPTHIQDAAVDAIRGGKHGYTPSAGIDELRAAAARSMGALRGTRRSRPTRWWSAPAPSPSSATRSRRSPTTASATKSSFPCPGFPIYESQIVANGAVPVGAAAARIARLRVRPERTRGADRAEDAAADPEHAAQPDRRPADARGPRGDRRGAAQASGGLGVRRRDLQQAGLRRRLRVDRDAARHARAHHHLRRRVEDLRDDRLAHRLHRERDARAGVHALDHQHRVVRLADQPVGGARGADRSRRTRPTA